MGILDDDGVLCSDKTTVWTIKYRDKIYDGPEIKNTTRSEKYVYIATSNHRETHEIVSRFPPEFYDGENEFKLCELLKHKLEESV